MLVFRAMVKSGRSPLIARAGVGQLSSGYNKQTGSISPINFAALGCRPVQVPAMMQEYSTKQNDLPIRVPLTPDNTTARFHRHEYVPAVQAPHKPVIFKIDQDLSGVSSEVGAVLSGADAEIYVKEMNPDAPEMPKVEHES